MVAKLDRLGSWRDGLRNARSMPVATSGGAAHRAAAPEYLIHVGMPQAGSSFLQDVLFPKCKDVHFISNRVPENVSAFYNPVCSQEDYFWSETAAASWLRAASNPNKLNVISFERFSCTFVLSRHMVAQRLARLCPRAKCLIVVRNQYDAIVSMYAQRARNPLIHLSPFEEFFFLNMRDPQSSEFRRYFYDELVSDYENLFGPESVFVLPYEMLRSDGGSFVRKI